MIIALIVTVLIILYAERVYNHFHVRWQLHLLSEAISDLREEMELQDRYVQLRFDLGEEEG